MFGTGPGAEAAVTTPSGVQTGDVTVVYTLTGDVSSTDVSVAFSKDGGSFREATQGAGGDGTENLAVSAAGTMHTFVWASADDLSGARESSVVIRVEPDDGVSDSTDAIKVHNGRLLAAVESRSAGRLRLYALDAVDGDLAFLASYDTGGTDPYDVIFSSGFFYVAHRSTNDVAAFQLDEGTERLVRVDESPFHGDGTGTKYLAADSKHVYASNTGGGTITVFDIDSGTGKLTLNPRSGATAGGCRGLVVRSTRLFVASETSSSILIFDIATDGELLPNAASPVTSGGLSSPDALVLAGTRIYAANTGAASICGFNVLGDGSLVDVSGTPFATSSSGIESLARNASRLLAVDGAGRNLMSFTIDPFGALSEDGVSPAALSGDAFGVASAGSIAALGTTSSRLEVFDISSGVLSAAPGSPFNTGVEVLRVAVSD